MEVNNSSPGPLKQQKPSHNSKKALDRISILPDSVLLHILSFVPARCAIRTSILSKRWQFLWTFVPVFDFADCLGVKGTWNSPDVVSFISNALILHQSPKLKKLRLYLNYKRKLVPNFDVWLRFATRKKVEELEIDCLNLMMGFMEDDKDEDQDEEDNCYVLPFNVMNNSSLVSLKLVLCKLQYGVVVNWSSLKYLSFNNMPLSNDLIRDILRGSPSLEFLELRDCMNFDFLEIKSETMRKLVLEDYGSPINLRSDSALKIVAPNIKSLEISGNLRTRKLLLTNSSSLVNVQLDFCFPDGKPDDLEYAKNVREVLQNLQHVKDLTVGCWCLEGLALLEMETLPSLPSKLESLRLSTYLSTEEQSGIMRLLSLFGHGCVPLTLVIDMEFTSLRDENYLTAMRKNFAAALERIKTVKIIYFTGQECEIQFVLFLLKNARHLEKMIIHAHPVPDPGTTFDLKKSFEIAQRILSTPRCSENSLVFFA